MKDKILGDTLNKKKKWYEGIEPIGIVFIIILFVAILSYIVPAGEYDRIVDEATGRTLVDPDTFHYVEGHPTSLMSLLTSVSRGMQSAAEIIFFVLIVGGAFKIVTASGAIEAGIHKIAVSMKNSGDLLILVILFVFGVGGATFGMAEETIVFIPIGIALARAMGYDAIVGMAMVNLGAACGFNAGFMNPFNVGVAQSVAELPTFSGLGLRLVLWVCFAIATGIYIIRYGRKVKADPSKSLVLDLEIAEKEMKIQIDENAKMTKKQIAILLVVVVSFAIIIFGVFKYEWYITEISAVFLAMGLISGFIARMGYWNMIKAFQQGISEIAAGAAIVGVAKAIVVVMEDAVIIDSVIHGLASAIAILPSSIAVLGMYLCQLLINFFVHSGSGQAALTMPIMTPIADILGVTRQTAVLAFQLGDGITNSLFPTSVALMTGLSIGKIKYDAWIRFIWKLILVWVAIGVVFLLIANAIHYGPF